MLHDLQEYPMHEQKKRIEAVFHDWKQSSLQVDDVLVMGIKID